MLQNESSRNRILENDHDRVPLDPAQLGKALELTRSALDSVVNTPASPAPFSLLLTEVAQTFGAASGALLVSEHDVLRVLACSDANEKPHLTRPTGTTTPHASSRQLTVQLDTDHPEQKMFLSLVFPVDTQLTAANRLSLDTAAAHLGNILICTRRIQTSQKLALYQERAVIARELHDSLAQSLSYLKIQVSRLQSLVARESAQGHAERRLDPGHIDPVVQEMRAQLNLAYRQLREIITTFRLTMDGRNLNQALEDTVEEFQNRSMIAFTLDNRITGDQLSVNEELQVLQITREALSNCVRHSHARRAEISLHAGSNSGMSLVIDDDGVGIDTTRRRQEHHGLIIMQQRAHGLGGTLTVTRGPTGGTRVQVQFTPESKADQINA